MESVDIGNDEDLMLHSDGDIVVKERGKERCMLPTLTRMKTRRPMSRRGYVKIR